LNYKLEIATTDFAGTEAAVNGGADRIELCSALSEGGLTPSFGLIRQCRKKFSIAVFPIIRPRGGDFLYSDDEYRIIKNDVALCKQLGCDGIVVGFLKRNGNIDKKRIAKIVEKAYPLEVSFHRAFDRCDDPFQAMEDIIDAGCQRILTSGQELTVTEGAGLIKKLIKAADNRIIIMPGSGVKKENIKALAEATGAEEFHASLRSNIKSKMDFLHPSFSNAGNYEHSGILEEEVRAAKEELKQLQKNASLRGAA
jgi:copper homeostasis protein